MWHNYSSREAQELFQNFEILKPVWQNKTAAYYTTIKFNNLRYFRFFPRLRYDILFCHIKMQSCFSATTISTGCLFEDKNIGYNMSYKYNIVAPV